MDYWFFLKEEAFRSLLEKKERKRELFAVTDGVHMYVTS